MSVLNLIRPELLSTSPYTSEKEARYRLHANELPWSPLEEAPYNCYPDYEQQKQLAALLANQYQVQENQIALTRGSDEGIDLIARLFLTARKDALLCFPPTFSMYAFLCTFTTGRIIGV